MLADASQIGNQDENSWVNVQQQNVETPAFNSKIYEIVPTSMDQTYNQEFNNDQ